MNTTLCQTQMLQTLHFIKYRCYEHYTMSTTDVTNPTLCQTWMLQTLHSVKQML